MQHRPQCDLAKPCEPDIPEHGLCGRDLRHCMHCMAWCYCAELEDAEQRALAAALQRVQALCEPTQWRPAPRSTLPISKVIAAIKGDEPHD